MKLWEAMKALEEGKKIRIEDWNSNEYIMMNSSGYIINEKGHIVSINNVEWTLYDERKEVEKIVKDLYNILTILYDEDTTYDEFLYTLDEEEYDDTDYVTNLYYQLQHMNKTYKLDENDEN